MKEIIEKAESLGYYFEYDWRKIFKDKSVEKVYLERYSYIELCLIQKWLRGKKVFVFYDDYGFVIKINDEIVCEGIITDSIDQALEEGIKEALEILEKK